MSRKGDHEMEKAKNIIEIKNLHKSFGEVHAVNDLSFCVKEGELFAFLGINGAGKSTTIDIICGQLAKDSGEVYIKGKLTRKTETALSEASGLFSRTPCWTKTCRSATICKAERRFTELPERNLKNASASSQNFWIFRI